MTTSTTPPTALVALTTQVADALTPQQITALQAAQDAHASYEIIREYKIANASDYEFTSEIVKEAKEKAKFLDQERKITVTPLNDEVSRVNDWFRPGIEGFTKIAEHGARLMSNYVLAQKREEQRLLKEAQEAAALRAVATLNANQAASVGDAGTAQKATEEAKALAGETAALVQAAGAALPPTIKGVNHKPAWKYVIKNPQVLVRAHPELAMPNDKALKAWVALNGNKNVPAGVEVEEDVKINFR